MRVGNPVPGLSSPLGSRGHWRTVAPSVPRSACRSACVVVVVDVEFAVIELANVNGVQFAVIALAMADADASAVAVASAGALWWRLRLDCCCCCC